MAEALIDDSEPPNVFFFVTERQAVEGSKKQYCYSNNPEFAQELALAHGDRESRFVEIAYQRQTELVPEQYHLELDAADGHVSWDFTPSTATSPDYASKLVNALDAAHDLKSGFLVFYLPESAVVDQHTVLNIGSESYPAEYWSEISKPPYFDAYRAVHSRDVHDGYFGAAAPTRVEYSEWPNTLGLGSVWRLRETTESTQRVEAISVAVAELTEDSAVFEEGSGFGYAVVREGDALLTRSLFATDGSAEMRIDFEPPLPDLRFLEPGAATLSTFAISLTGHAAVVTGQVSIVNTAGSIELLLAPGTPDWTKQIRLRETITLNDDGYGYQSTTEYPGI
jgi:hypothetical protein